jgi:hypothetical protein
MVNGCPDYQKEYEKSMLSLALKNERPQVTASITRICRFLNIQFTNIEETKRFSSKDKSVTCMTC